MNVGKLSPCRSHPGRPIRSQCDMDPQAADRKTRATCLSCACGVLLAFGSGSVGALGLGPIELASDLNERLDASIPVHNLEDHSIDGIEVGLAGPEHFRDVGLRYRPDLRQLQFQIEPVPAGGHRIRIRSPKPIVEPFVTFVLELKLPTGRLFREYTVLLDPPMSAPGPVVQDDRPTPQPDSPDQSADRTRSDETPVAARNTVAEDLAARDADAGPDRYGPVRAGDSAWQIAAAVRAPDTSIHQRMMALFDSNPHAFQDNDLGKLRAGVWLDIPSPESVAAIPQERAVAFYKRHIEPSGGEVADETVSTDGVASESKSFGLWAAHASEANGPETSAQALVSSEAAAMVSDQAGLSPPPDPWRITLGDHAGSDRTIASLVAWLEQEFGNSVASRDARFAALREELDQVHQDLNTVHEELSSLRNRQQSGRVATSGGIPYWAVGLVALLTLAGGATGGFWAGRRLSMRRLAAVTGHLMKNDPAAGQHGGSVPSPETGRAASCAVGDSETGTENGTAAKPDEPGGSNAVAAPDTLPVSPSAGVTGAAGSGADSRPGQQALPMTDAPLLGRSGNAHGSGQAEGGEIHFQEADINEVSDFYHSLAKLYLASGWPGDAEALLRSTIEQKGDKAIYRVRILEALYQLGHRDKFLRDFEAYRALADENDPSWTWVRTMGRILWPDNPSFEEEDEAAAEGSGDGYYELEQDVVDPRDIEGEDIMFELNDEAAAHEEFEGDVIESGYIGERERNGGIFDYEEMDEEELLDILDNELDEDEELSLDVRPDHADPGAGDFPTLKPVDDLALPDPPADAASGAIGNDPSEEDGEDAVDERQPDRGTAAGRSR